jgi:hypothetical protein
MQSSILGMTSTRRQVTEQVGVTMYQEHTANVRRINWLFTSRKEEEET